jgi:hypothetical protein
VERWLSLDSIRCLEVAESLYHGEFSGSFSLDRSTGGRPLRVCQLSFDAVQPERKTVPAFLMPALLHLTDPLHLRAEGALTTAENYTPLRAPWTRVESMTFLDGGVTIFAIAEWLETHPDRAVSLQYHLSEDAGTSLEMRSSACWHRGDALDEWIECLQADLEAADERAVRSVEITVETESDLRDAQSCLESFLSKPNIKLAIGSAPR